jgi:hypothetical protein
VLFSSDFAVITTPRTDWGYDDRNELTSARRYDTSDVEAASLRRLYDYDAIGNWTDATAGTGTATTYATNGLNEYTGTQNPSETFAYYPNGHPEQNDGNLLQDATFTYTWDGENRLVSAAPTWPVSGNKKLEFAYDYRGRRVQKQVSTYNGSTWIGQVQLMDGAMLAAPPSGKELRPLFWASIRRSGGRRCR